MPNIACSLLYNNGNESPYVGFLGSCSIDNIKYNIEKGSRRWCSQPQCLCRQYYDDGFKGRGPTRPCNESLLFSDWQWNPGAEFKTGEPFYIREPVQGKIAVLTTRFREQDEEKYRKIVGFFKIHECVDERIIVADNHYRIRLLREEAEELNFWEYHRNEKGTKPLWSQGRFRYWNDPQVAALLHDLRRVVRSEESRSMLEDLIQKDFPEYAAERPDVNGCLPSSAVKRILLKRKYGSGGESENHRHLKEYIARHPELLGINPRSVEARVEHLFPSGDLVDILFEPKKEGKNTVVEIELDCVLPGLHQAIKYRALRCAQLNRPLDDVGVEAFVVAWSFTPFEDQFCQKYSIKHFSFRI